MGQLSSTCFNSACRTSGKSARCAMFFFFAICYFAFAARKVHSLAIDNVWNAKFCHSFHSLSSLSARNRKNRWTTNAASGIQLRLSAIVDGSEKEDPSSSLFLPLMKLASAHFSSQALYAAVRQGIPDIIGENLLSLNEISASIGNKCNSDALCRTMRLLTAINVVEETHIDDGSTVAFSLTKLGKSLCKGSSDKPSMASCIVHWMERPLWDAWLELPPFILEGETSMRPFERANSGVSSDVWYNAKDHPESLKHANDFVRLIYSFEIEAVVNGFDWSLCRGKRLVDIGGHHGQLIGAIAQQEPTIECFCLDLPHVISSAPTNEDGHVKMIPGNIFDPATIPDCDAILMKHFLDRCMWDDDESIQILKSCYGALTDQGGILIIAEAVLPDFGRVNADNTLQLSMDALYMLVGREGQRTQADWKHLADASGFEIERIEFTNVPSCSLVILKKQ